LVDFNIDVEVGNKGLGPSLGAAPVAITAVRTTDAWIGLKEFHDVPALAAGGHVHVNMDVQIARGGSYELQVIVDSSFWVTESHEDDNVVSKPITVAHSADCGKL
jgi:hypothetical protein